MGRYGRIYAVRDSPVAGGEEVASVWVLHSRWHLCIVSFPLACRDMTPPCHGTRPHAGLRDLKKQKKKNSITPTSHTRTSE